MSLIINPGSGPVAEATYDHAHRNMCVFVDDVSRQYGGSVRFEPVDPPLLGDGRFRFTVYGDNIERHEVDMPGCSLGIATGADCASIFDQPRLYVDGSSWLWGFAVDMCGPKDGAA